MKRVLTLMMSLAIVLTLAIGGLRNFFNGLYIPELKVGSPALQFFGSLLCLFAYFIKNTRRYGRTNGVYFAF